MSSIEYKIVAFGGGGAGKSATIIRFVGDRFMMEYNPTVEDSYRKQIEVDGRQYVLTIIDTAGQEEYSPMRDQYIALGQGFLLAYSITSSCTFKEVKELYEQIVRVKGTKDVPIVLFGCKCDIEDSRQVTSEQGEELARQINCPFFEVSAKNNIHIDDIFSEVVREITARLPPEPAEESKKSNFFNFFKRK